MDVTIRAATIDDAASSAACHLACWREAYADIVDPETLTRLTSDLPARTERWRDIIASHPPRWLALDNSDVVVGFSAAGDGRDDDINLELELYAIYVRAAHHGTGIADGLLTAAIGAEPAYLWVLESNPRAHGFYARHGFRPDGARKLEPLFEAPEIRMIRT